MYKKKIILASGSPRRKMVLKMMGLPFKQTVSRVPEHNIIKDPGRHVLYYSRKKAEAVAGRIKQGLVLGADTVVASRNRIFGKPGSPAEARKMLQELSNKKHLVITGITLIDAGSGTRVSGKESTEVIFRRLAKKEIDWYVKTGEPMDKAGAYGIQEQGCFLVNKINGCYFNVVGLPVVCLYNLLKKAGYFKPGR